MKIGMSTYCLVDKLRAGTMSVLDVLEWAKEKRCEHVELVPYGYSLVDDGVLADRVRRKAEELGLELSNYALPANFVHETEEGFRAEVERLKSHVDLLVRMGIRSMRHDVVLFTIPPEEASISHFEKNLFRIVEGSREIADYAAERGITTNVENHGWGVQHSDRVQRVLEQVGRPNFRTVLDIGNFLCVDESPLVGTAKNLPHASIVHVKDFYIRPSDEDPGEGKWFRTSNGNFLRGAIFGQGDMPVRRLLKLVKSSGYDGYLTLEFEGMEESMYGTEIGLRNLERLWNEV
mgnify:CR=1 FL=1